MTLYFPVEKKTCVHIAVETGTNLRRKRERDRGRERERESEREREREREREGENHHHDIIIRKQLKVSLCCQVCYSLLYQSVVINDHVVDL